jgi:hypothetical protein
MQNLPIRYDGGGPVFDKDGKPIPPGDGGCGCFIFPLGALLIALAIWYAYK